MSTPDVPKKALSATPLGYLLAVLAGIPAGLIGIVLSPLVLFLLNILLKDTAGKPPNRFAIWAVVGVLVVPITFARNFTSEVDGLKDKQAEPTESAAGNKGESNAPTPPAEEVIPAGWSATGTPGIYWKWCSSGECDTSKVIGDNSYALVKVWCKKRACGDIYARANLMNSQGVVVGWTNDTGFGDLGQEVQLTLDSHQDFASAKLTELNFR